MKKLQIQSIRIVSRREKSAKRVDFHPQMTVIRGDNDTGKSSTIKSIYWTFGADPAVIDESWKGLDIASAVVFKVEDVTYTIVRHQDRIAVFDGTNQKLISTSRVTAELAPFLAVLFDSGLLLNNRQNGKPELPPPAFTFLPFYIDQDKGWVSTWSSFGSLGQYSEWQTDVAEYHIGLRNNNFYKLKSKVKEEKTKLAEPLQDEQALRRALDRIRKGFEKVPVELNVDRFKKEIEDLLEEAKPLVDQEENFRLKISSMGNRRLLLQHQLNIVSRTITELTNDYEESLSHAECVECPTCGATYHNSIGERFKLMMDEDDCRTLANDVRNEMLIIEENISELQNQMEQTKVRHFKIWDLLEARQGDLTLEELLDGAARKQAISTLQSQLDQVAETIADYQRRISDFESTLKQFAEPERKKRFLGELSDLVHNHCIKLKVSSPEVNKFHLGIRETGSDRPRSILAHNFAILKMKWNHSDSVDAPLIIDSPNQQDQDLPNLKRMLEFIRDETPKTTQLILGLVDTQGIEFGGSTIVLENEKALLRPNLYSSIGRELEEFLAQMYSSVIE